MIKNIPFSLLGLFLAFTSINAQYTLTDADVTVSGGIITSCTYSFAQTDIIIPSSLDGQTVTGIGDEVFQSKGISSVLLPASIQTLGNRAFRDNLLTNLNLSSFTSLQSIGSSAFGVNSIVSLDLSACSTLQSIGEYAFDGNEISSINLAGCSSLLSIEAYAFSANSISDLDLSTCTALQNIGSHAFYENAIESIDLSGCTELQSIGYYAFRYNSLLGIDLSACTALQVIGEAAFYNNTLSSFALPAPFLTGYLFEHWVDGAGNTFAGNSTVTNLATSYTALQLYSLTDDDVVVSGGEISSCSYDFSYPAIHIPSILDGQSVTGIGDYIFQNKGITFVRLPSSIETIGSYALSYNAIPSLDLSACTSLKNIEYRAFNVNNITNLDLSNCTSLVNIGELAFYGNSLPEIILPEPDITGYIFRYWEDGDGATHAANSSVSDFRTSYTAILVLPVPATVTTQEVSDISGTTATGNGTITDLGAPDPTQHGICYNTSGSPTLSDSFTEEGPVTVTGAFTSELSGLSECTLYYVRAYVTNTEGTTYGTVSSFTTGDETSPVPDQLSLPDINEECEITSLTAPTATDNCAGTISGTHNAILPITSQGTTTITWTYSDGNGNSSTQTQNLIVDDISGPVPDVTELPDVTAECEVSSLLAPTATDNCMGSLTASHDASLPISTQGTTSITWTYDDGNGNLSTQTQNVIIADISAPIPDLADLPDITAECEISELRSPTATDNCMGTVIATHDAVLPINEQGTTLVTWTFDDGNGNTVTQSQNVIIDDISAPVPDFAELSDITAECEISSLTAPTASDNCTGVLTATHDADLPINTQGTTLVTWTFDDGNGNTVSQSQNVLISDLTIPTLSCISNQEILISPEQGSYIINGTEFDPLSSDDNCGVSIISNSINNLASLEGVELLLGTTNISWTVIDEAGNSASCSFDIVINQETGREDITNRLEFYVYPNPASDYLFIKSEKGIQSTKFEIINITGKVIKQFYSEEKKSEFSISLEDLEKGIYFIRNDSQVMKFIKL